MKPVVLGPGEGETIAAAGNTIVIKADAAATDGRLAVVEYTAAPGFPGPPPHVHHEMVEVFYPLEGELTVLVAGETVTAAAGSFVLVPPGVVHTFSNPGSEPCRYLIVMLPGGFEQYFRDVRDALGEGPLDPAVMAKLASGYDIEAAGH